MLLNVITFLLCNATGASASELGRRHFSYVPVSPCAMLICLERLAGDQPDHALVRQAAALVRRLPVMDVKQFDSSFLTVSSMRLGPANMFGRRCAQVCRWLKA